MTGSQSTLSTRTDHGPTDRSLSGAVSIVSNYECVDMGLYFGCVYVGISKRVCLGEGRFYRSVIFTK